MKPVRIGVVGVGDFGVRHARIAAALVETELVAVADYDAARRTSVADELQVPGCADIEELLASHDVDAVVVATPQSQHLADIAVATAMRVHALVEKPVVGTEADLDRLLDMDRRSQSLIVPAHVSRFLPAVDALRRRLEGALVHAVRAIRVVPRERLNLHGHEHPASVAMVHDLDLVRAFLPGRLRGVTSVHRWTEPERPHPQVVVAQLEFDDAVATVENHWTLPHARQYIDARLEVTTAREVGRISIPSGALQLTTAEGEVMPDTELEATVGDIPVGALSTQMRYFARCVSTGMTPRLVTLDDAIWSVRVAAQIEAQTGSR